jgi:hypothetical protein
MSKIKQTFVFFKEENTPKISDNELFVNGGEMLMINTQGTGNVEIQGIIDKNSTDWYPLAVIDKSNLAVLESIDKPGIYSCSVDGYLKIRAEIKDVQGNLSVYVNLI